LSGKIIKRGKEISHAWEESFSCLAAEPHPQPLSKREGGMTWYEKRKNRFSILN
jgi:hypothetical protein